MKLMFNFPQMRKYFAESLQNLKYVVATSMSPAGRDEQLKKISFLLFGLISTLFTKVNGVQMRAWHGPAKWRLNRLIGFLHQAQGNLGEGSWQARK